MKNSERQISPKFESISLKAVSDPHPALPGGMTALT